MGNLVLAFLLGDFGAKSRDYSRARQAVAVAEQAPHTEPQELDSLRADLERSGTELARRRNQFWPHIWLGIAASLIALLVNSISITYFIGTVRWCREVADAYSMSDELPARANGLKRQAFAWALAGILLTLAIAATGGAADPFSSSARPDNWVQSHWMLAMGGVLLIAAAFYFQLTAVRSNHEVIQEVLAEADRIRRQRSEA